MLRNQGNGTWLLQCSTCSEQVVLDDRRRTHGQARQEANRLGYALLDNDETCPVVRSNYP